MRLICRTVGMDFILLCDEDDIGGVAAHVVALKTVSTCGTSGPNMLEESAGQMLLADCSRFYVDKSNCKPSGSNMLWRRVVRCCCLHCQELFTMFKMQLQCTSSKKEMRQSVVSYCNCFMLSILKQSSLYQFDTETFHPNNEG